MKPPYKWVGGKASYLPTLTSLMPKNYGTYYEVFFGGGALYFHLAPKKAVLGDANQHNINFIKAMHAAPDYLFFSVRDIVERWNGSPKSERRSLFEVARKAYNERTEKGWAIVDIEQAAGFYALVRGGFNGLWRVNRKGLVNTPVGDLKDILLDEENFFAAARALKKALILHGDFEQTIGSAGDGDFVFVDPPYYGMYDGYTGVKFEVAEHHRLWSTVDAAVKRGAQVMITVNDHPYLRSLYRDFRIVEMERRQTVAAGGDSRKSEKDIVIVGGY